MRRTRVLMLASNKVDGTSYYRAWGPYSRIDDIDLIEYKSELAWCDMNYEVALVQRPADQYFVHLIDDLKRWGVKVIVDYDDDVFNIDPTNQVYEYYQLDDKIESVKECLRQADVVTVSTQALKESFLEQCPDANIVVIPNAVDDYMFSTEPSYHERNKIILLRGGSGHVKDWEMYKEPIIQVLKDNPEYSLAVMGYTPKWLREVPEKQLRLYEFVDIPKYFEALLQMKPEIMIVPLEDTKFNRAKSNIALIEGSIAGAAVMSSDLPEFRDVGACVFTSGEELKTLAHDLISDEEIRKHYYDTQLFAIPKLSEVNELRKDLIESLTRSTKKKAPYTRTATPATALQFHNYELSHGYSQDNKEYEALNKRTCEWIIKQVNPKTAFELGAGTGGVMVQLLKAGVQTFGIEINPHSVAYFKARHPMFAEQMFEGDITKEPIETNEICDLAYSFEVWEHIDMPEEWWDQFVSNLATKFRWFYFSSTPYYNNEFFDKYWGHINIRTTTRWIELFTRNGWEFHLQPKALTSWDILFKSSRV